MLSPVTQSSERTSASRYFLQADLSFSSNFPATLPVSKSKLMNGLESAAANGAQLGSSLMARPELK